MQTPIYHKAQKKMGKRHQQCTVNVNVITYGGQVYKTASHADLKLTHFKLLWRSYWTSEKGY